MSEIPRDRSQVYRQFAADILTVLDREDDAALERIHAVIGRAPDRDRLRAYVLRQLLLPDTAFLTSADAQFFTARMYGFDSWDELEASVSQPPSSRQAAVHGVSASPPFYRIRREYQSIEPKPPLSLADWEELFEVMRAHGLTGIQAAGQMTDEVLERVARLDFITDLQLESSARVTDAGLRHLRGTRIEKLNLTGCSATNGGLSVLPHLPALREFYLYWHPAITDEGLAHLGGCKSIERVDLLGCRSGDGAVRALAGKPRLSHFKSGQLVTDTALPLLHEFPAYRTWQGGESEFGLLHFDAGPNFLLLRGSLTDAGLSALRGLDGLFGLNLDDSHLELGTVALHHLAALPRLQWLGFDATDSTMPAIATLPHLRMLMCQDTSAGEAGFAALAQSPTLEYIWARRCHNLNGRGFAALSRMPNLRGFAGSHRNVDDAALAMLPHFPALREYMPMDVPDSGFRHIGACERLEELWCMYCRDTGDAATEHLINLPQLKTYYAGQSQITDRSMVILSGIRSLERVILSACAGVTNAGVARLAALPNLKELSLEYMPRITRSVLPAIPSHVQLNFET